MRFKTKFKLFFPHVITSFRVILAPFLLLSALSKNSTLFLVFALIGLASDYLDDVLAERWYVKTSFSKRLDMTSDKVFELALLIGLLAFYHSHALALILEMILIGVNIYGFYKVQHFENIAFGKIKSICLWISIFVAIFNLKIGSLDFIVNGLFAVSTNFLFLYLLKRILRLREEMNQMEMTALEKNKMHQKIMQEQTIKLTVLDDLDDRRY